jgi:ABC-type sulfate/molybdate transport systems ATPase subunit
VFLRGEEITARPTHRRRIGLVSQEPSLFVHRTVRENIAYGPLVQGIDRRTTAERVNELLDLLDLRHLAERSPGQISGGEQQRTALARALAPSPPLVLLDEPFAAVDPELRGELRSEFRRILADQRTAALHVTHDRGEGLFLGERVLVLLDGRIEQAASPEELQRHPASPRIAKFLGYNLFERDGAVEAVWPSDLRLEAAGAPGPMATVRSSGFTGAGYTVYLRLDSGGSAEAWLPAQEESRAAGARVILRWDRSVRFGQLSVRGGT